LRLKSASLGFASGQFNLNDALSEYNKKANAIKDPIKKAAFEEKVFGKVHILTGQILTKNIGKLNELTHAMTGTNEATKQAEINNASFGALLGDLRNAFKNSITATGDQGVQMNQLKDILRFVANNMDKIISTIITIVKWFAIYKAATYAVIIAQNALNAAIAIGKFIRFVGVIMKIARAKGIWTAVQWALNTAMNANPIGLIIIAIAALAAGIIWLVKNWKDVVIWMQKVWEQFKQTKFIQAIIKSFEIFVNVIKNVVDKLKEIGNAIKTFIIDKFKAISEFVSKIVDRVSKFFGRKDKIKAEENLNIQVERQGNLQDVVSRNAGTDLVNNFQNQQNLLQGTEGVTFNEITNREVITRERNNPIVAENKSRVDLFLNNRASNTEVFTEGTGVEVHNTGY
jgi:hypothetical protein